jgi:hypothetical protein
VPIAQARSRETFMPLAQPRHGRLRAQGRAARRRPARRHLEDRITAQRVAIVAILVAGGDREHAKAQHVGERMIDPPRVAPVLEAARQPRREPELALRRAQQQHAAVRRRQPAVERHLHVPAIDR